ncbi:acyl-CoA thioesterase II [Alteriqipengyuania sp. WL0013]|uniref:acyl-CoA thioesterase n=1 Tax=Alteriqipengyuania sp. WL0013 TaxID=3110773 RepID=UPI002C93607C|nr:acyl-CoA thioesterase II [Alteriqipengyuania sp. WL0013]MEB3415598.1 acyl-CoA thioesterase II [Alteriqipengyuania sp. WL0013]
MTDSTPPEELVARLMRLFTLTDEGDDVFTAPRKGDGIGRVFGGQVIAQALAAAESTVAEDRHAHSLHAYFLRGGSEEHDITLKVDRQFDGGSFSNRRVVALQPGGENGELRPILNLAASFQKQQAGLHHQLPQMPDVPGPDELESEDAARRAIAEKVDGPFKRILLQERPIEIRPVGERHWERTGPAEPIQHAWFRVKAPLPDDPRLHRAALAWLSDMQLLGTSALPHGLSWARGELKSASLDHAIWFHEPFRADEWLLYSTDSPWTGGSRGFNRGSIFAAKGRLVASVAQEGMIRDARG